MRFEANLGGPRGVTKTVVLASASPRRTELLRALIDTFEVLPSDVPEPLTGDPHADSISLAAAKALAISVLRPGAVVIGADTIVYEGSNLYGKPLDAADAVAMLRALSGREHGVVTGVAVVEGGDSDAGWSEARITLADLSDAQIAAYVASGRPMDKAGAYAIQDDDVPTVATRDGCYCCTMGLPLWRLKRMLEARGLACRKPGETLTQCIDCPERDGDEQPR